MIREGRLWLIQTLVIPTFSTKSMLSKELLLDGVISESFTKTMVIGEVSKSKIKIKKKLDAHKSLSRLWEISFATVSRQQTVLVERSR